MKYLIIVFWWTAYCALHSYLISTGFTNFLMRVLKNFYSFFRLFYIIISLVLLVILIKYTHSLGEETIVTLSPTLTMICNILTAGTLIIFLWAFFLNYNALEFFGLKQIINFGKEKKINPEEALSKKGLLGIVRHPMYFALIIFLWVNIRSDVDLIVNSLLTVYVIIGTILEEKKLILEFGDIYIKYQQEVPMLIPFVKKQDRNIKYFSERKYK